MISSHRTSRRVGRTLTYVILILCAIICILPFLRMINTSFKTTAEAYTYPPTLIPRKWMFKNYPNGLAKADFLTFAKNTVFLAVVCTAGTVLSAQFVAYGFARFKARFSGALYSLMLATLMLPAQVTLLPQYLLYFKMHMIDTYWPLIIPAWLGGGTFNIFLFIQFFKSMPRELDEAATIDGANPFQTFGYIMMPSIKSVSLCVLVMALVYNWKDFYMPLIYLNSTKKFTIAIGLQFLNSSMGDTKIGQMMAVAVVTMVPVLIIFFLCQKYFIEGIKMSGLKG